MSYVFLSVRHVLLLHEASIRVFGGSSGMRDEGLLQSAIGTVQATFGGQFLLTDEFEMAASLLFSIVKNHPFVDGNKRTGLAAAKTFLEVNGRRLIASQEAAYNLVLDAIANTISKDGIASFFRENTEELPKEL